MAANLSIEMEPFNIFASNYSQGWQKVYSKSTHWTNP
jgi:hypothetical protein